MTHTVARSRYRVRNCDSAFQAQRWQSLKPYLRYGEKSLTDIFAGDGKICRALLEQNPQIAAEMNSVVRASLLYEDELVIDAHDLFDGIFFMALGPDYFHSLIDDRKLSSFRLVVQSRAETLPEALKAFIAPQPPAPSDTQANEEWRVFSLLSALYPDEHPGVDGVVHDRFCFKNLSAEQSEALSRLRSAKTSEDIVVNAQKALEMCMNLEAGSLSFVRQRWEEWFEAAREGAISVDVISDDEWKRRTSSFSHDMYSILETHRESGLAYICGDEVSSAQWTWHHRQTQNETSEQDRQLAAALITRLEMTEARSDGFSLIDSEQDAHPQVNRRLFARLKDWYDTCYQLELAQQRGARLLVLDTEEGSSPRTTQDDCTSDQLLQGSEGFFGQSYMRWASNKKNKRYAQRSLSAQSLPAGVVSAVSDMSSHDFRVFTQSQKEDKSRVNRWRMAGRRGERRFRQWWTRLNLLHVITNYPQEDGVGWSLFQVILLLATIGLAFASVFQDSGGWPVTTALLATAVQEASDTKDLIVTSKNMGQEVQACVIR